MGVELTGRMTNHSENITPHQLKPIPLVDPTFENRKILEYKGMSDDLTCCTYIFYHQDHTLGNALRAIINQYEGVEMCGYTTPHPLERKIHLRIQLEKGRDDH